MSELDLKFFKHTIDGKSYGGWYRLLSLHDVEVQTIGLVQRVSWEGINPEAAARYCLEDHIRTRLASGYSVPSLHDLQPGDAQD